MKLLTLTFINPKFKPHWLYSEAKILFKKLTPLKGKPLLTGTDKQGTVYPLITKLNNKYHFAFSFEEQFTFLLNQEYIVKSKPLLARLPFHYHHIPFRITLNKILLSFKKKQPQPAFPQWPTDISADVLYHIYTLTQKKKPQSLWPKGKKYAVFLTHDIDTEEGLSVLPRFLTLEESFHLRSTNFIVANYYPLDDKLLQTLLQKGHEIGCHGDNHDYILPYLPQEHIKKRLEKCVSFFKKYHVKGFRAPSLLLSKNLENVLPTYFSYDTSITDTELFMPDSAYSGSCTVFPFFKGKLLRIPITLPMDSSLLFLEYTEEQIFELWMNKIRLIKNMGAVVSLVTHSEQHFSANKRMLSIYQKLLKHLADDKEAWVVTGKELTTHLQKHKHHVPTIN